MTSDPKACQRCHKPLHDDNEAVVCYGCGEDCCETCTVEGLCDRCDADE